MLTIERENAVSSKQRQEKIVEILEAQGYVTVKYLCELLHYSSATINRDLNSLAKRGLVIRSYGGVEPVRSAYIPILFRANKMRLEKRQIGKAAAAFVKDGDTIFIDGSTTAQYMEQYLIERKSLTVITNNIILAVNLSKYDIHVICLGGSIVEPPCMLCGSETVENAQKYKVDKMFFATKAMTSEGLIASGEVYDLMLKTVAKNAKEVFYLVDHKKIDQPFDKIYGDLSCADHVISDHRFPQKTVSSFTSTDFLVVDSSSTADNMRRSKK